MTANIFGGRFMSVRKPAWHNIGKVLDLTPASLREAFGIAGMDYEFIVSPIFANAPTGGRPIKIEIENRFALLRQPTQDDPLWRDLGVVSGDYQPIQNMELADLIDSIELAGRWPVETVGALGVGERIFATFKAGKHFVRGLETEELDLFFLLTESRGKGEALKLSFTPVRVVCQNTLELGLAQALTTVKIPHVKGVDARMLDSVKVMAGLDKSIKDTLSLFDAMAALGITDKQALAVITKAYPTPIKPKRIRDAETLSTMPEYSSPDSIGVGLGLSMAWATETLSSIGQTWTRECARIEGLRSQAFDLYNRFNDEQPQVARTGWAVVNAVVEAEDYRDGPEGLFASTLWGARAQVKARAMAAVGDLMG